MKEIDIVDIKANIREGLLKVVVVNDTFVYLANNADEKILLTQINHDGCC